VGGGGVLTRRGTVKWALGQYTCSMPRVGISDKQYIS
jgi:hypothetical protein